MCEMGVEYTRSFFYIHTLLVIYSQKVMVSFKIESARLYTIKNLKKKERMKENKTPFQNEYVTLFSH